MLHDVSAFTSTPFLRIGLDWSKNKRFFFLFHGGLSVRALSACQPHRLDYGELERFCVSL